MQSFIDIVRDFLRTRGPVEIQYLVRTVLKSMRTKRSKETLMEEILIAALNNKSRIAVVEYPKYGLKISPESLKLPRSKYARIALLALKETKRQVALPTLVNRYNAKYKHNARCPEFWMWHVLGRRDLTRLVTTNGALCVNLTKSMREELNRSVHFKKKLSSLRTQGSIAQRIDEKSLETLLASRPDLLESGLTVFQRQSRIPVGIIDLLCIDRNRNYVVVEIKRPAADYREVVGQIATYMGWVRRHIARRGQAVRGIIVVGQQSERLEYSLDLLPDISVRTFF